MKIQSQPLQRIGVVFLLIAAAAEFLARGPVRIEHSESGNNRLVERRGIPSPYPPTTFVLLAPLVLLPWKAALWIWIAASVLAVGITLLVLARVAGIGISTLQGLLF